MGGVAMIARAAGHRVTGCDRDVYPPMSDQLRALGIELIEGYGDEQISLAPDVWVIGNVATRGMPLVEAVLSSGERYMSGPEWLKLNVLDKKWVLAIAGTHGKTTTSAMLAWILESCGRTPGFLIGGVPMNFGVSARSTGSEFFVIEADEYDTAFFDKRSKFLHYPARTTILNNLEFDHADIFDDLAAIERQFHQFIRILPGNGLIVANAQDAALQRVLSRGCWTGVERFGSGGGWTLEASEEDDTLGVCLDGRVVGRVAWSLLGDHNRLNAVAAVAAAHHAGIEAAAAVEALGSFAGVRRRLERRGVSGGVTVYDDFAHHPTAIRSTLGALRRRVGAARILAVLEPRSNTMRRGALREALPDSVAGADRVFVHGEDLQWDPAQTFAPLGERVQCHADFDALLAAVSAEARAGDHVLVMSNGAFRGIHQRLLDAFAGR